MRRRLAIPIALGIGLGALLAGGAAVAETRRALLVGIDAYVPELEPGVCNRESFEDGRGRLFENLCGSVSDVTAVRGVLTSHLGFTKSEIFELTDRAATREAILREIRVRLVEPSRPGDIAFFYYAGHGSFLRYEVDGKPRTDQTIVPWDAVEGVPDVRDKELKVLFRRIAEKGAHLTMIFDSCHSGTITRDPMQAPRAAHRAMAARVADYEVRPVPDAEGPAPEDLGALRISASRDHQQAGEWPASGCLRVPKVECQGAFTRALVKAIRTSGPEESAQNLHLRARAFLKAGGRIYRKQDPILAGSERAARPLLGVGLSSQEAWPVVHVEADAGGGRVLLDAGAASGLHVGTRLGPVERGEGIRADAALEVEESLGPSRSRARVLPVEAAGALTPGTRLRVTSWAPAPRGRLRVWASASSLPMSRLEALARAHRSWPRHGGIDWTRDPGRQPPSHVVRREAAGWVLRDDRGGRFSLGDDPDPARLRDAIVQAIGAGAASVLLDLPPPDGLVPALESVWSRAGGLVERVETPREAEYQLVGVAAPQGIAWAWVRPGGTASGREGIRQTTPIPPRTSWRHEPAAPGEEERMLANMLAGDALRLAQTIAWLELEAPPDPDFPYRLAIRSRQTGTVEEGWEVTPGVEYELLLRDPAGGKGPPVRRRYVYIVGMRGDGERTVLFPAGGQASRLPSAGGAHAGSSRPAVIDPGIGAIRFDCSEDCYGGTFFLLTMAEPLPAPSVLEGQPVRTRAASSHPVQALLDGRPAGPLTRSATQATTWSISSMEIRIRH